MITATGAHTTPETEARGDFEPTVATMQLDDDDEFWDSLLTLKHKRAIAGLDNDDALVLATSRS